MTYNEREINAEELFEFMESISKFIEKEIKMYALGGTALTILNIKKSTKDIDVNIESNTEYEYICKIFSNLGFERNGIRWITQEGLAFDMFHGSNIMGTELLPDCIDKSKFIKSFGNIKIYTLSLEDIIISKLARGDSRDFDDIKRILEVEKINLRKLVQRYKETMEVSVGADYQQKLLDLIEIKFKEWKFSLDNDLIDEVKEWESK
ncbi:MAG: nucleotidyltransferase [Nanoarchaeota archaeon]|nr:nucleotidyltransferase [Nanoarchaeota archaeon]MBU1321853.1 nucleotidyltransferase [Nanoarchaeota archaeon]MBU1597198.1 nucleotidyltransferase [Nanoarchaeota archaeon]MBU2441897.1 nucleotidyltransferase [Nanoarchaeota archaeon]